MATPNIFASRAAVKDALWLYAWLLSFTKAVQLEYQAVADGLPIPDSQIAFNLDTTTETVGRWRRKLERLDFIRSEIVRARHRRYWIVGVQPSSPARSLTETPVSNAVN